MKTINFDKLDTDIDLWLEKGIDPHDQMPMEMVMHDFPDYWENKDHFTRIDSFAFIEAMKDEFELRLKRIIDTYTTDSEVQA